MPGFKGQGLGRKLTQEHKDKIRAKSIFVGDRNPMKSIEMRRRFSEMKKGANAPGWKGGVCAENELARKSIEYRLWRESVFKRDNFTCQECGIRAGKGKKVVLNADHIKRFAEYPELRYAINNGRTLCAPCHRQTDTYGINKKYKAIAYLQELVK